MEAGAEAEIERVVAVALVIIVVQVNHQYSATTQETLKAEQREQVSLEG